MALLRIYKENSNGMLTIKEMCIDENPEFAQRYDISRVPTILFIDNQGREIIRYLAAPQGGEIHSTINNKGDDNRNLSILSPSGTNCK